MSTNTPASSNTQLTGTGYADVVAAPAAATQRLVSRVNFHNVHASIVSTVTVCYLDNATTRVVAVEVLNPGERFQLDGFILDATNRSLRAKLDAAATVDVVASYADRA